MKQLLYSVIPLLAYSGPLLLRIDNGVLVSHEEVDRALPPDPNLSVYHVANAHAKLGGLTNRSNSNVSGMRDQPLSGY